MWLNSKLPSDPAHPLLEVCAADIASVVAATHGGASRIELCSALSEGGVTPSAAAIAFACRTAPRTHVLIRPRSGDFVYSPEEKETILADIDFCRAQGVDGVVVGALTPADEIDIPFTSEMIGHAGDMSVTFSRAFDLVADPHEALERLVALGCSRVLTSGCAASALEGIPVLKSLVAQAQGRIGIIAAAGIKSSNVERIIRETGVREVHASASRPVYNSVSRRDVHMGAPGADSIRQSTSESEVAEIVRILKQM